MCFCFISKMLLQFIFPSYCCLRLVYQTPLPRLCLNVIDVNTFNWSRTARIILFYGVFRLFIYFFVIEIISIPRPYCRCWLTSGYRPFSENDFRVFLRLPHHSGAPKPLPLVWLFSDHYLSSTWAVHIGIRVVEWTLSCPSSRLLIIWFHGKCLVEYIWAVRVG